MSRNGLRFLGAGLALLAACVVAHGQGASPFLPPPADAPRIVRLLAPPESVDRTVIDAYEAASGWTIAYDSYADASEFEQKWKEERYDLVLLGGRALARRIAVGAFARLDKSKLRNVHFVQPAVTAKMAFYDPGASYAVPFGWTAYGLLYDPEKARPRLGGAPVSWAQWLLPREARRMADCGLLIPDVRDEAFLAAWRLLGVDAARANANDVKNAGALLDRIRPVALAFAAPDVVGAMARGTACLAAGTLGEAEAANARSDGSPAVRFAYPREGALLLLVAFAIPRDAVNADQGYALLDFLLRPDNATRDAKCAGLVSAEDSGQTDSLKRLSPEPVLDDRLTAAMEAEWKRLRAAK